MQKGTASSSRCIILPMMRADRKKMMMMMMMMMMIQILCNKLFCEGSNYLQNAYCESYIASIPIQKKWFSI